MRTSGLPIAVCNSQTGHEHPKVRNVKNQRAAKEQTRSSALKRLNLWVKSLFQKVLESKLVKIRLNNQTLATFKLKERGGSTCLNKVGPTLENCPTLFLWKRPNKACSMPSAHRTTHHGRSSTCSTSGQRDSKFAIGLERSVIALPPVPPLAWEVF